MGPAAPNESSSAFAASRSLTLLQQMQVEGEGGGAWRGHGPACTTWWTNPQEVPDIFFPGTKGTKTQFVPILAFGVSELLISIDTIEDG